MSRKHTFEEVKEIIEKEGCKLLSTEYKNNKTPLLIQCACGEVFTTTFANFNKGKKQCDKCTQLKRKNQVVFNCDYCGKECSRNKSDFEGREHHFCSRECKDKWQEENLLGENNPNYGNHGKLNGEKSPTWKDVEKVPCEYCGNPIRLIAKKSYYGLHFCNKECYDKWQKINAPRGEDSPHWNPEITDEERKIKRNYPEYNEWVKAILKRDSYTCQCCGQYGGSLNAHHLNSYNWDKEHRIDINNGIVVCEDCHKEFHKIYGYGNNTIAQFREFLFNKYTQTHDLKFLALIENIDLTTRAF